ncbi:MAG: helix-turn-helix domain-containing protein [Deltaproteobacteria bacterium]|nr:helix-turn-helix domain-containing protein [Deltaproteobacteria bacterium]
MTDNVPTEIMETGQVLLTRTEAAKRMGVSVATVRRMEGSELQVVMIDGKHLFHLEEVDRYRRVSDGDLAAQVFQMFNEGYSQVEVVIQLKESPDRIRKLHNDWVEMSNCIVALPKPGSKFHVERLSKTRITPALTFVCIDIVLGDPELVKKAERELGAPISRERTAYKDMRFVFTR